MLGCSVVFQSANLVNVIKSDKNLIERERANDLRTELEA